MSVAEPRPDLEPAFVRAGKVRDIYRLADDRLLLVASDRISAFDVVLPTPIPDKGIVLTGLSRYWFAATASIVPNHVLGTDPATLPEPLASHAGELRGRIMICRAVDVLPIEVIVRGYLAGSGWKEYRADGTVCGIPLPSGLRESDRLPEPLFTPSTKEEVGHDQNISYAGSGRPGRSCALPRRCRTWPWSCTGSPPRGPYRSVSSWLIRSSSSGSSPASGRLLLVDEVLTPDSSRFWDATTYQPGQAQESFDKQFVRDWLDGQDWDKAPPGPELPEAVVMGTRERYAEAFARLTGVTLDRYLAEDRIA